LDGFEHNVLTGEKREYVKITKDYALEAAKAFADLPGSSEPFRFIYVSGEGATHDPGRFSPIFARVKGETELALAELRKSNAKLWTDTVRPGMVDPIDHEAIKPFIPNSERPLAYRLGEQVLAPVMRTMLKSHVSPTEPLGRFMTDMAMGKYDGKLSGNGVIRVGDSSIVENVGFRRLFGL
jgi:hypothetical protein